MTANWGQKYGTLNLKKIYSNNHGVQRREQAYAVEHVQQTHN